jgi:hypothetical protein
MHNLVEIVSLFFFEVGICGETEGYEPPFTSRDLKNANIRCEIYDKASNIQINVRVVEPLSDILHIVAVLSNR